MADDLSAQRALARMAQQLNAAQAIVSQLRRMHRADELGGLCLSCRNEWPCDTFRILDTREV